MKNFELLCILFNNFRFSYFIVSLLQLNNHRENKKKKNYFLNLNIPNSAFISRDHIFYIDKRILYFQFFLKNTCI